ncbi:lasso peptide biosynthesis B2 protein [Streptomyces sp. UNOC14_S4]|uniref:lasso peptide biosynthesis B2 protein n=1 Tax=Streptomyces sp. UNOC14_S4 TaxID=2872340 RepID=UPI001E2E3DB0|nr:lasso peptide biosynthesis B2 protein [Streptomyces sp. UNOC14_S4]MCC3767858.1 lasso peptide biosynthesis B2 protein [Streptomyces sp. UNOC14_S4]
MSIQEAVPYDPRSVPLGRRCVARLAVGCAHLLAVLPPHRIRTVLTRLRGGSRPATLAEASAARETVLAVSLAAGGQKGCLVRSLATVLLCRWYGQWPTWCVGVRVRPPFAAHTWVEAEGVLVGEGAPSDYYRRFFAVECPRNARRTTADRAE